MPERIMSERTLEWAQLSGHGRSSNTVAAEIQRKRFHSHTARLYTKSILLWHLSARETQQTTCFKTQLNKLSQAQKQQLMRKLTYYQRNITSLFHHENFPHFWFLGKCYLAWTVKQSDIYCTNNEKP